MSRVKIDTGRWPAPDREMWVTLFRRGSLLDEAGALSHLRPASRACCFERYDRWLRWVAQTDPALLSAAPATRATAERLWAWVESLTTLAPASREAYPTGVLQVLAAARPDLDWSPQRRILAILGAQARRDHGSRKLGRILSSKVLVDAGLRLAGQGAQEADTALKAAQARRDGAMVAMLALMPMRRRAFIELALGSSCLPTPDGHQIVLSEEMTKTGQCWEARVPDLLASVLDTYTAQVRPWLMARGGVAHDRLWVGNRGAPYEADYFSHRIRVITQQILGVPVSPHFFRDSAATTMVRVSSEHARLVRPLLAHSSFKTAERHYIHARAIEVGRDYADLIAGARGCAAGDDAVTAR